MGRASPPLYGQRVTLLAALGTFTSKPFPPVAIESDSGYWSGSIPLGDATLPMSLYIDASVSDAGLQDAAALLGDLLTLKERAQAAIGVEAERDPTIMRDFFQFHLEEVPDCLPKSVQTEATNEAFVGPLELVGVAIHAEEDSVFQLVLDVSFGRDYSDQRLAVKLRSDGTILSVDHES